MSRTVFLIRHAKSMGSRFDRHLFPKEGAPLSDQGIEDAKLLKIDLQNKKIDPNQTVAISELIRTKQTAEYAGFEYLKTYSALNEVDSRLLPAELDELIKNKDVPESAITAAQKLLENPPEEDVWVTHGMLIAGIGHVLQIPTSDLYIPAMASITQITID